MEQLNIYVLALFIGGGVLCLLTLRLFWKQGLIKHLPALFVGLVLSGAGGVFIALGLGLLDYQIVPGIRCLPPCISVKPGWVLRGTGKNSGWFRIVTNGSRRALANGCEDA